jgi:hypothetical protein
MGTKQSTKTALAFSLGILLGVIGCIAVNQSLGKSVDISVTPSDERLMTAQNYGYWMGFDIDGEAGPQLFETCLDDPSVAIRSKCALHLGMKYRKSFVYYAPRIWEIIMKIHDPEEQQILLTYYLGIIKPTNVEVEGLKRKLGKPEIFNRAIRTVKESQVQREKQSKNQGKPSDNK